ncbi:sulfotransferase [Thermomonas sp.]|uniref:tetratricopeptide repeat-containing sulfotransferase family protein n=1 Tax=Thermomonas sp. TaxID=1971895 RepID=UPI0035B06C68
MDPEFERQWRQARTLEQSGDMVEAKKLYEALVGEDPDRLYVRLRLAAIEQGAGRYRVAREQALECARIVRAGRWKDLAPVTRLLLAYDEWSSVRDLILGADWASPEVIREAAVLSQHLWLVGEVEDARRMVELALPLAPGSVALRYSRASILRYLGRVDEAAEEFEACLDLSPTDPYAHWSLAQHSKASPPGARIKRILAATAAMGIDRVEAPYLQYALFKEYDDAGEDEAAWRHLHEGARLRRAQIRYDGAVEEQGFNDLRGLYDANVETSRSAHESNVHTPIFIVGMPRSGTTLLERILGGHPEVAAAGELNEFQRCLNWHADTFLGLYPTPASVGRLAGIDLAGVGSDYLARTVHWARGKRMMVDKNPANFVHAGAIARAIPQARILCLRRNPMDACFSNLKNLFSNDAYGYSYTLEELADYYVRFDALSDHWRKTLPKHYMEVSYEALVADPAGMAERVMAFCGLPFDPNAVDITRNTAPVTTASSSQVRQPINRAGVGAWRKYERGLQPLRDRLEARLGPVA